MVIADTSVLIDLLAGRVTPQTGWLIQNSQLRRIGITTLILSEVLQGIRSDEEFVAALGILDRFALRYEPTPEPDNDQEESRMERADLAYIREWLTAQTADGQSS